MRKALIPSGVSPRPARYSRATRPSGRLFRGRKLPLRQRDSAFLRHNAHRLGKADVFHFADEGEYVARDLTPEAVEELARSVHVERARLLLVKGAQADVVRARLTQANVSLDDL